MDTIQSMTTLRLLVEYHNAHMSAYVETLVLLHVDDQPHKAGVSVVQSYSLDNSSQPCLVQQQCDPEWPDLVPLPAGSAALGHDHLSCAKAHINLWDV